MPKFFIEVPHAADRLACARVVQVFLQTGSHFLTNAEWGCADGEHKAWIIIETDTKEEAQMVVPPAFRQDAKVTRLNRFSMKEIDDILAEHAGQE